MEQKLTFQKSTKPGYVAETTVTVDGDFALRIESEPQAHVAIFASSVIGRQGQLKNNGVCDDEGVFDQDYDFIVYPKHLTIRTTSSVIDAYIKEAES